MTGAVTFDVMPAGNALRPFLTGCGIAGAFSASLLLSGGGGWWDVASFALRGGGFAWLAAAGWEAFDAVRIANHLHRLATGSVQTVQPDLTLPRPLPAPAEIVLPDTPVSHAEREARHEALRLLTDAARVVGWDGNTIPRYTRLRWGNERRAKAVASLAEWLEVTPGRETRVKVGTIRNLHDAIQSGKVKAVTA